MWEKLQTSQEYHYRKYFCRKTLALVNKWIYQCKTQESWIVQNQDWNTPQSCLWFNHISTIYSHSSSNLQLFSSNKMHRQVLKLLLNTLSVDAIFFWIAKTFSGLGTRGSNHSVLRRFLSGLLHNSNPNKIHLSNRSLFALIII